MEDSKQGGAHLNKFKEDIYNDYFLNNLKPSEIAIKYNVKKYSVQYFIRKHWGLKNLSEAKQKYKIDLSLFEKIDESWKAYFLGWLYSDGNIYRGSGKNTVSLCIVESDREILDYFNNKIYGGVKPLNYRKAKVKKDTEYLCKPLYRFQIDSSKISDDLLKLGLVENKSLIKEYPKINPVFNSDFIQGYFEGNGSIATNRAYPNLKVRIFSGSEMFLNSISHILKNEITLDSKVVKIGENAYSLDFSKKENIIKFFNYIYTNKEMVLKRKYLKFNI